MSMNRRAIFIVDDEKNIRLMLSQTLEAPDVDVATAANLLKCWRDLNPRGPAGLDLLS
jgi:DNA-binding NtrC family response regulator